MGFGADIEDYSSRSSPEKAEVQQRLATMEHGVLGDLGLSFNQEDHQGTGDGMYVFLPPATEVHRALPRLIQSWQERLRSDNQRFRDRMRLRLATAIGPTDRTPFGFGGNAIVEMHRLLNSTVLRHALRDHPDADLAILVSDQLYSYVVVEGYPGLNAAHFQLRRIRVNGRPTRAWLWIG